MNESRYKSPVIALICFFSFPIDVQGPHKEEQGIISLIQSESYAASMNWKQISGTERSGFDAVTKQLVTGSYQILVSTPFLRIKL